jgi:hypothetical protein
MTDVLLYTRSGGCRNGWPVGRRVLLAPTGTRSTARKWCQGTHNSPSIKEGIAERADAGNIDNVLWES